MTLNNGQAGNGGPAAPGALASAAVAGDVPVGGGMSGRRLSGGRMTWAQAVSGALGGATCLWQDLDGLHVEPPPADPPPTSILWGWRGESVLVRARLDGDTAYVAVLDLAVGDAPPGSPAGDGRPAGAGTPEDLVRTIPWAPGDDRVAAARAGVRAGRGPASESGGVGARYEQVIIEGIEGGPVTFVRPASTGRPVRDA
jgi:hypothetical protein